MNFGLIIPTFIAGVLTFLAPCTLPLVPGYLGFISGVSTAELTKCIECRTAKRKILLNGFFYVLGFSTIFVLFGVLFGLGGAALIKYRELMTKIGGVFVILFGLYMMQLLDKIPGVKESKLYRAFNQERTVHIHNNLKPGTPISSFIFGATFAFGWSPCVGPILGTVLTLAYSSATVLQGAFLLFVFSMGLGLPFLLVALIIGSAGQYISWLNRHLTKISFIGGLFLVLIGILLITDSFDNWTAFAYRALRFVHYDKLLNHL